MSFQPQAETLTYETYFGLHEKPFSLSSDPRFLYQSPSHAATFENLLGGIRRREGLLVLTGEIGTGKTTLCHAVLRNLRRKTFSSFVPDPFVSREDLLKMLLVDFGVISVQDLSGPLRQASRTELCYLLSEFLESLDPLDSFVVVIIDEAQNMSLPLIEETRILADSFGANGRLQIVFVGQLELHGKLQLPEMRQVDQRVCSYNRLAPLASDGVAGYVQHRLHVAGLSRDRVLFPGDVIESLHRRSGGVPRLINRICDRALHLAHRRLAERVDREILESALNDVGATTLTPTWASIAFPEPEAIEKVTIAAVVPSVDTQTPQIALHDSVRPEARVLAPPPTSFALAPPPDAPPVEHTPLTVEFEDFSKRVDEWLTQELAPAFRNPVPLHAFASASQMPSPAPVPGRTIGISREGPSRSSWFRRRGELRGETYMTRLGRVWAKRAAIAILSLAAFGAIVSAAAQLSNLAALSLLAPAPLPPAPAAPAPAMPSPIAPPPIEAPSTPAPALETPALQVRPAVTPPGVVPGDYFVAVALFATQERADRLVQALAQASFPAVQRPLQLRTQLLQQVVLGPFVHRADAASELQRLRKLGGYDDANVIDTALASSVR